jgi:hypothetical protein
MAGPACLEYVKNAEPVIAALAELAHAGQTNDAIRLAEHAIAVLLGISRQAEDPAGLIADLIRQLLDIHLDASRVAPREPARLADWLLRLSLDEQDCVTIDVDTYADPLGESGLAVYRAEVERRWAAGDWSFGVRRAKERLAFLDRDVAALVELLGGNLAMSRQYLHVAMAMRQLDRYDDALGWALRGLAERPDRFAGKLYDFAVGEYLRRGAQEDAVALRRRQHAQQRTVASYLALRSIARAAGTWDEDRPAALAQLDQRPGDQLEACDAI